MRPMLQSRTRLYQKYGGAGTWAVITGGSDGIGLSMAKNLAAQGFNICIVGRNEAKINDKMNELAKVYPVKYKAVIADFARMHSI